MRRLTDTQRLWRFMKALGAEASRKTRVYFTGGASAVVLGWRTTTIGVDIKIAPERDEILRAIVRLKESLEINVELAAPSDFIPKLPAWERRSLFVATEARVSFHHYDFYAQSLAKIERSHARDQEDVREMIARGLIEPKRVSALRQNNCPPHCLGRAQLTRYSNGRGELRCGFHRSSRSAPAS